MKLILTILSILLINLCYSQDELPINLYSHKTELVDVYWFNPDIRKIDTVQAIGYTIEFTEYSQNVYVKKELGYSYKQNKYFIHIFRFKKLIATYLKQIE